MDNFPLDYFVDKYNLKHCKNAITRLKEQRANFNKNADLDISKRCFQLGQDLIDSLDYIDIAQSNNGTIGDMLAKLRNIQALI